MKKYLVASALSLAIVSCGSSDKKKETQESNNEVVAAVAQNSIAATAQANNIDLSRYYISSTTPWTHITDGDWAQVQITDFDTANLELTGKVTNGSIFTNYNAPAAGSVKFKVTEATTAYDLYVAENTEEYFRTTGSGRSKISRKIPTYKYSVKLHKDATGLYNNKCDITVTYNSYTSVPFSTGSQVIEDQASNKECIFIN